MNANLMHPPSVRTAEYNACPSVETKSLKISVAVFATWTDLAHTNLVTDNFNGLLTRDWFATVRGKISVRLLNSLRSCSCLHREFSFDSTHVRLSNLSRANVLLHFPGFFGVPSEEQKSGRQPVQAVDGPKVLEAIFLSKDEDDGVVSITSARMNLKMT